MSFAWPYYTLHNGRLYDESCRPCFRSAPRFASVADAESWLVAQDERGNVRESGARVPRTSVAFTWSYMR